MKGFSLHWFVDLFTQVRTGDVKGSFDRSMKLAVIVTIVTVVVSFLAGLAFRQRFRGDGVVFYLMIGSLVAPGLVLSIGVGLLLTFIGVEARWYTSAVGAQLSWTLPFGVLVMFAVMSRFDRAWEEAAYDLGASRWQTIRLVVIPILAPGLVAVALFGFTLSDDEFARTLQTAGSLNTLPLELRSMTLNVTSPSLYALGTVTTIISFLIIVVCLEPSVESSSGGQAVSWLRKENLMAMGPGHIEPAGIVKSFDGHFNAVDGVNCISLDGAYCCLLGPSGCGKTTILRMIAGHDDPTAGEILIGGENVVGMPPVARRTAMMFQSYALFPHLSVPRQYRLRSAGARSIQGRTPQGCWSDDRESQTFGVRRQTASAVIRRAATARGAGACCDHRAACASLGRTAFGARRVSAHSDAPRIAPDATRAWHHVHSRDAHAARGDRARRSRRGNGQGKGSPGRRSPRRL